MSCYNVSCKFVDDKGIPRALHESTWIKFEHRGVPGVSLPGVYKVYFVDFRGKSLNRVEFHPHPFISF